MDCWNSRANNLGGNIWKASILRRMWSSNKKDILHLGDLRQETAHVPKMQFSNGAKKEQRGIQQKIWLKHNQYQYIAFAGLDSQQVARLCGEHYIL